ncbi:Sulfatase-modifying factor enzyme 1 [Seminavis robusta]|uniref:Sulfatase-modifying factor enzyme 1 n=1 Tax=Seminavis robusta TaxID=568900 RepID=A0A9N8HK77_9STRA|nr:Sulfatase-modifying factor enzyme 1 [Seminavis robusta]|eukprot:Sro816_g206610.1 Sulfatase-modifying factor enzyme 1 (759) ;mRNA; f:3368-5962
MPHVSDTLRFLPSGTVIFPAVMTWAPGDAKGSFRWNIDSDLGGRQLTFTPGFEDVWVEWRFKQRDFKQAKRYEITMRYQTDEDQGDAAMSFIPHAKSSVLDFPLNIPSTDGNWSSLKFVLDHDVGGFNSYSLRMKLPVIKGSMFNIKDFTMAPPGSDETGEYSGPWFSAWFDEIKEKVEALMPSLEDSQRQALLEAGKNLQEATKDTYNALSLLPTALELERGVPKEPEPLAIHEAVQEARQAFSDVATDILDGKLDDVLEGLDLDNMEVLQWLVFIQGTPTRLGSYCHEATDEQIANLIKLMKGEDVPILKQMMLSGGAKGGNYGKACEIYNEIGAKMNTDKSILPKLQMAVALELCEPLAIFDTTTAVDAVERYFDYEKAYLDGMLDPAFEHFSVWELRMVVDSDASNEELRWCREFMFTYRPDILYMGDQRWRYSSIVKTDVRYKRPDWTAQPRTMVQALARGGKCGPRAWFGRFCNKAFGNPTWGLVQPSHAALAKWTPTGWLCCLGSNLGYWHDRDYLDFTYEAFMRKKMGDEFYCRKVDILMWMFLFENGGKSEGLWKHKPDTPWTNLAQIQRKRWGDTGKPFPVPDNFQCEVRTKISDLQQREDPKNEEMVFQDDGTIIVPASAHEGQKAVTFAKCLEGGKQFNVGEMWWIEYKIPGDKLPSDRKRFKLTVRVASTHDEDPNPFQCIVTSAHHSEKPMSEHSIPFPYTKGLWEETEPVEIELGGGGDERLKFMRQKPCWPVTVRDFKLTPA